MKQPELPSRPAQSWSIKMNHHLSETSREVIYTLKQARCSSAGSSMTGLTHPSHGGLENRAEREGARTGAAGSRRFVRHQVLHAPTSGSPLESKYLLSPWRFPQLDKLPIFIISALTLIFCRQSLSFRAVVAALVMKRASEDTLQKKQSVSQRGGQG